MLQSKFSERYLCWFYWFGISVYNPRNNSPSKGSELIPKFVPSTCFLLTILVNSFLSFDILTKNAIHLSDYLHAMFVISMLTTGITAFKRASFVRRDTKCVWKSLLELDLLISNQLKFDVNIKKFLVAYTRKLICMILVFSCFVAVKFLHRFSAGKMVEQIGALILLLTTLVINFHLLFYIDLFNFIYKTINEKILKSIDLSQMDPFIIDVKKTNFSDQIIDLFKMLKLLHFELWEIVRVINNNFGTILISIILQNTNTVTQTFYWIIVRLYEDDLSKKIRIISMYCYRNCH